MSQLRTSNLRNPSLRLNMQEFFKEKMQKLDDAHTAIFLKHYKMEKDLAALKETMLMHEGAVLYLKKFTEEWTMYDKDTQNLHKTQMFDQVKVDAEKQELKKSAKKRKKKKKKG